MSFLSSFGLGGTSGSQSANTNANVDRRQTMRDGAQVSGDSNTVNMVSTDYGAVAGGLQLGTHAVDAVVKNAEGLQRTTETLYAGALQAVSQSNGAVQELASKVAGDLATAFTDSKAPDKSLLMIAGAVVVGLAALAFFARKGA